jgi:hypothetical protein
VVPSFFVEMAYAIWRLESLFKGGFAEIAVFDPVIRRMAQRMDFRDIWKTLKI